MEGIIGNQQVIEALNTAIKNEFTAVHQYLLHARLLEDWGFNKRAEAERKEVTEELGHADKLMERVIFLEGKVDAQQVASVYIGGDLRSVIECDQRLEVEGIEHYRASIKLANEQQDFITRDLLKDILRDEEGHFDRMRTELELIERIGIENYGLSQM